VETFAFEDSVSRRRAKPFVVSRWGFRWSLTTVAAVVIGAVIVVVNPILLIKLSHDVNQMEQKIEHQKDTFQANLEITEHKLRGEFPSKEMVLEFKSKTEDKLASLKTSTELLKAQMITIEKDLSSLTQTQLNELRKEKDNEPDLR